VSRDGRLSSATEKALLLVKQGLTRYAAAKKTGIALSTIYRAAAKAQKKKP
jgi:transposase